MRLPIYALLAIIASLALAMPANAQPIPRPSSVGSLKWMCGTIAYPNGDRDKWCYKAHRMRLSGHRINPTAN